MVKATLDERLKKMNKEEVIQVKVLESKTLFVIFLTQKDNSQEATFTNKKINSLREDLRAAMREKNKEGFSFSIKGVI